MKLIYIFISLIFVSTAQASEDPSERLYLRTNADCVRFLMAPQISNRQVTVGYYVTPNTELFNRFTSLFAQGRIEQPIWEEIPPARPIAQSDDDEGAFSIIYLIFKLATHNYTL